MSKRELPDWMETELRDLATSVRASTIDICIKTVGLAANREDALLLLERLRNSPVTRKTEAA